MFNFISWPLFFTTLTLIVVLYYLITTPLLFYKEISNRVKSFSDPSPQPSKESSHQSTQDNLMGFANEAPLAPQHKIIAEPSPEDFITTGSGDESDFIADLTIPSDVLIGSVADLLQEIKNLLQVIAEDRTGKTESKALFNALLIRYPHLHNTSYSQAINFYLLNEVKDKFPFELTLDDLQSWWTPTAE